MFFDEKIVDYNSYFVFVCIYVFFGKNRILQLLISQARIYSNKVVTYSQINIFLNKLKFNGDIIHLVFLLLTPLPDSHSVYKMTNFINVIKSLNDYRIMICGLKNALISTVLSERIYENIAAKVTYNYSINDPSYEVLDDSDKNDNKSASTITILTTEEKDGDNSNDDLDIYGMENRIIKEKGNVNKKAEKEKMKNGNNNNNNNNNYANQYPKESCCSKFTRVVFTNIPPPYTYDYYLVSPDKYSFDNIIYNLKHKNGYGQRNGGDSSARSLSFKLIMSGRHNSSKLSNTSSSLRKCPSTAANVNLKINNNNNNTANTTSHLLINVSNINSTFAENNISSISKANTLNNQVIASHSILQQDSIHNAITKNVDRISITTLSKPNQNPNNKSGSEKNQP